VCVFKGGSLVCNEAHSVYQLSCMQLDVSAKQTGTVQSGTVTKSQAGSFSVSKMALTAFFSLEQILTE